MVHADDDIGQNAVVCLVADALGVEAARVAHARRDAIWELYGGTPAAGLRGGGGVLKERTQKGSGEDDGELHGRHFLSLSSFSDFGGRVL